jgi:hypothetical protein
MVKNFISIVYALFFVMVSVATLRAASITVEFSGMLDGACGNFTTSCDGFGLGLNVGDPFTGRFSYDSDTGAPTEFFAQFPNVRFDATNLELEFQPFDGTLELFGIQGTIPGGLFLTVGLTNGTSVRGGNLPTFLTCADWFLCGFQINDTGDIPFESDWAFNPEVIRALNSGNSSPGIFSLQTISAPSSPTVPEPSSLTLLSSGLIGFLFWWRKKQS